MRTTGILLGTDIRDAGIIVTNPSEKCFKPASYDLRIGDQFVDPALSLNQGGNVGLVTMPLHKKGIVVPAYSSIVVSTHEIVKTPKNVIGKFNLRIKWALAGLFVQMGTQVEPDYHGRLFAVLHNITARDITIKTFGGDENKSGDESEGGEGGKGPQNGRDRIFTIEFYYIGEHATNTKPPKLYDQMADFVKEAPLAQSAINEVYKTSQGFKAELGAFKEKIDKEIEDIKSGLVTEANKVIRSAEVQLEFVHRAQGLSDTHYNKAINRLELDFESKNEYFSTLEAKVDDAINDVKRERSDAVKTIVVGGIVVVLASALIPYCITLAVGLSNPEKALDPLKEKLAAIEQQIADRNTMMQLKETAAEFEKSNAELVKRVIELQNQLNLQRSSNGSDREGGQPQ